MLAGTLSIMIRSTIFTVAFPLFEKAKGRTPGEIGLLISIYAFTLFVFGVPITAFGGRGLSRQLMAIGPAVSAFGLLLLAFGPESPSITPKLGALVSGFGSATFWILSDPVLAASAPSEKRSSVFALKYFLVTIGLAVGGGLGGWIPGGLEATGIVDREGALAATMVVIALVDLLSAGIFLSVPAMTNDPNPIRPLNATRAPISMRSMLGLLAFCVPGAGLSLGHNSIRPFLSLFFTEAHGLSEATTGTLLSLLALAGGVGSLAMPHLGQRFGPVRAIVVMRGICAAMVAAWFLPFGLIGVIPAMVIYYGIADGTEAIFISEAMHRMDTQQRIWFSGLNAMAWSLMSSGGTLLSGFNQDRHGGAFGVAFMVGAGGYVLSLLWVAGLFRFAPAPAPA